MDFDWSSMNGLSRVRHLTPNIDALHVVQWIHLPNLLSRVMSSCDSLKIVFVYNIFDMRLLFAVLNS